MLVLVILILSVTLVYGQVTGFVKANGSSFTLNGKPYRFAGTNCYYLIYKDHFMVDDVLTTAAAHQFQVIRTWGFLDIGHQNGSGSVDGQGPKDGVYLQYYDDNTKQPAYNEAGLQYLDYIIAKAGSVGVRILVTLTNNWRDFGGMDQYVRWKTWANTSYQGYHDDFYSDDTIRGWFKAYIQHLVTRKNTVSGVIYSEDPAIFGWELGNEPRCQGSGDYGQSNQCVLNYAIYGVDPSAVKTTAWVTEMSTYIHSIDKNHMVAVGDEGFYCERYQDCPDATCDCYYGTDTLNFTKNTGIDFMSLHLYPDQWGKSTDWANDWISNHSRDGHNLNKPVLLGEYGYKNSQHTIYQNWTNTVLSTGMNGDLFWMISGRSDVQNDNGWYQNYDGYAVYCPNSTAPPQPSNWDPQSCDVLTSHAKQMASA